jgi:xylulokinase
MVALESEFEPNAKLTDLYGEQHQIYRGFYEAMANAGQYQALSDFALKYQ